MRHIILLVVLFSVSGCAGSFSCTFESDEEFMERIFEVIELEEFRNGEAKESE